MEPQFLKQTINIQPEGEIRGDVNSPYSFIEWKQRRPSVIEGQAPYHYNQYILNWFRDNKTKRDFDTFLTKQKYLYLLDQLKLFFTEDEKTEWYSKINLADKTDLLLAVPFFAKKLKNIALYYLNLRKKLKNTKIAYNTVGTARGLKQEIYNSLLTILSENTDESSAALKSYVPALSGLKDTLVVEIEELYDDTDYFDKNGKHHSISSAPNVLATLTEKYYNTKGISLSSDDWLFNSLTITPALELDSFINSLTATVLEATDVELYSQFIEKFISENKYNTEYVPPSSSVRQIDNTLRQGSNIFFYPGSNTDPTTFLSESTPTMLLSSMELSGATGGTTIENSDTIFVKAGNELKGAWLKYEQYDTVPTTMEASISQNDITKFIFPYPGYGLSAESFQWTGPNTSTSIQYNFLSNENKSAVNDAYWKQQLTTNSSNSIFINNTTLAANGATSNINFKFTDRLYLQDRSEIKEGLFLFEKDGAWLYRFNQAVLPILPSSETKILWPYQRIEEYSEHLKNQNFSDVCNPTPINSLNSEHSISSNQFKNADKIYKFKSFNDDLKAATECCWLSSSTNDLSGVRFVDQRTFTAKFNSGEVVRFLWTGPDAKLEDVFKTIDHNSDCPFVTNVPEVTSYEASKCTCKQVYYTPFGHPGINFYDYNELADFVALDPTNKIEQFDRGTWVDSTGAPLTKSSNFAWYRTNAKIGWGDGQWINGSEDTLEPFTLKRGHTYFYKRAGARDGVQLPFYSLNYRFKTNAINKWVNAKLNSEGEWVDVGSPSSMEIYPGDFIKYERTPNTTFQVISSELVENQGENKGSIWSTLDYLVSGSSLYNSTYVFWPTNDSALYNGGSQAPPFSFDQLDILYWWKFTNTTTGSAITINSETENIFSNPVSASSTTTVGSTATNSTVSSPSTLISTYTKNKTIVSFTPPTTGIYTVQVKAKSKSGTTVTFTGIPSLTVDVQFKEQEKLVDIAYPTSGFLLEQPLYGWSYNANRFDVNGEGAKPYWAEIYFQKDLNTKFKGVQSWGHPSTWLEEYLPDHTPKISPLMLKYGDVINYQRYGYSFKWQQPIDYYKFNGKSRWCKLNVLTDNPTNLSTVFDSKNRPDLAVIPTNENSDVVLSNVLNGFPVEVTYNALNSFVWKISTTPFYAVDSSSSSKTLLFEAQTPWSNLGNRFYATVATIPILEELYSESDVGGYFLPQHEGASLYINKNFKTTLNTSLALTANLTEELDIHVGGVGRTEQNQSTIHSWTEQNSWMKNSTTAESNAGHIKSDLTRTLQTFVPYEESNDETLFGLIDTNTILSPWSNDGSQTWIDKNHKEESFTGIRNVDYWLDSQVLKNSGKQLDCWTTDIFGNQYGLFKDLSNCYAYNSKDIYGDLWVRLNNQTLSPANQCLSKVFDKFNTKSFYPELTGSGIKTIDCFFDTLMIETSSTVLFCRLEYNYQTSTITTNYDNVVIFEGLNKNFRFENTWLQIEPKILTVLFTELTTNSFLPVLFKLDLSDRSFTKEFPELVDDWNNLQTGLSSIEVASLGRAAFSYNSIRQTYLITYSGVDIYNKMFVIEFEIEQQENFKLRKINRFFEQTASGGSSSLGTPPIVDLSIYGQFTASRFSPFNFTMAVTNGPATWSIVSGLPSGSNLTASGTLSGSVSIPGTYFINYNVTNTNGTVLYPLTLIII